MLNVVGPALACADRADPVIDVDVSARVDVRARQQSDREVGVAGPETSARISSREVHVGQN